MNPWCCRPAHLAAHLHTRTSCRAIHARLAKRTWYGTQAARAHGAHRLPLEGMSPSAERCRARAATAAKKRAAPTPNTLAAATPCVSAHCSPASSRTAASACVAVCGSPRVATAAQAAPAAPAAQYTRSAHHCELSLRLLYLRHKVSLRIMYHALSTIYAWHSRPGR